MIDVAKLKAELKELMLDYNAIMAGMMPTTNEDAISDRIHEIMAKLNLEPTDLIDISFPVDMSGLEKH